MGFNIKLSFVICHCDDKAPLFGNKVPLIYDSLPLSKRRGSLLVGE